MIFPYGIQTYQRDGLPQVVLRNMFVEKAETVPGKVVLRSRPGFGLRRNVGDGPINGLLYQPGALDNVVFAISGSTLYGDDVEIGSVPTDDLVQMVVADTRLLIAASDGVLHQSDGATVATIAFPDDAGVASVAFLGGYSIAARAQSRRFYFTLDPMTWDGLDYLSAEQSTDYIVGLVVVVDQLWVFCRRHVEIFFLTGDPDAPFQRVQGRIFDKGALTRDSIVKMDNTVFWVGSDTIVYRADATPVRISDHGIEERLKPADRNVSAWSYSHFGHLFYVLQLETETLVYDAATQQWHEVTSLDNPRWRARIGVLFNQDTICGDDINGNILALRDDLYRDLGVEIDREFTVLVNDAGFIDNITLDCSDATLGNLDMQTSRDGGMTWTPWRSTSLGQVAKYRTRLRFNRLGLVDRENMIVRFRILAPVPATIRNVRVNETGGGRSR